MCQTLYSVTGKSSILKMSSQCTKDTDGHVGWCGSCGCACLCFLSCSSPTEFGYCYAWDFLAGLLPVHPSRAPTILPGKCCCYSIALKVPRLIHSMIKCTHQNMNNKIAINTYLSTVESKNKINKQNTDS